MDLKEFAKAIRRHDWTACMSDDSRYYHWERAARAEKDKIATESPEHRALWDAGQAHFGNFTWEAEEGVSVNPPRLLRADVHARAVRFVELYVQAHDSTAPAAAIATVAVGGVGDHHDWYGRRVSSARTINWNVVDRCLEKC